MDRVQNSGVAGNGASCLIHIVNMFAEDIECRPYASFVQTGHNPHGVIDRFACNVAIGNPPHDGFGDCRKSTSDSSVQERHLRGLYFDC
jgi:hypothetical protein